MKLPLLLIIVLFCELVSGFPMAPAQFQGSVQINERYAGNVDVVAFDESGNICANVTTDLLGDYFLSCKADDPSTPRDEGVSQGEVITFTVNNTPSVDAEIFRSGQFITLNLAINSTHYAAPATESDYLLLSLLFISALLFALVRLRKS